MTTELKPCEYCNGTGDVHRADGEWLGVCHCATPSPVPELVRYGWNKECEVVEFDTSGAYVLASEAERIIADLKSEVYDMREDRDRALEWRDHDKQRAETAEAKLAILKAKEVSHD